MSNLKITTEEWIQKAILIHGTRFDYSLVNYIGNFDKVYIICKIHGKFEQIPHNHLKGCGCIKCNNDCKGKTKKLPFDFYIPHLNLSIEFDGRQHYEIVNWCKDPNKNAENFIQICINDNIKDSYCRYNNIPLLRIPYWDYDSIDKILNLGVLNPIENITLN